MQIIKTSLLGKIFEHVLTLLCVLTAVIICLPISKDGQAYLFFYENAENWISTEYLFWGWLEIGDYFRAPLAIALVPLLYLAMLLKFRAFKQLGANTWYLYLVYLSVFYLLHEGTQLRISTALAFALWSCIYAMRGQWLRASLLICIAMGFHITSPLLPLVFTTCYYYRGARVGAWYVLFIGFFCYVLNISLIRILTGQLTAILGGRYLIYSDSLLDEQNTTGLANVYAVLLSLLLVFLHLWAKRHSYVLPKAYQALLSTSVFGAAILFWLYETTAVASRLSDVLAITVVPLLAIVIARVSLSFQLASVVLLGGFFYMRLFQLF
jgi:EpsG family